MQFGMLNQVGRGITWGVDTKGWPVQQMDGSILTIYMSYDVFLQKLPFWGHDDWTWIEILVPIIFLITINSLTCSLMHYFDSRSNQLNITATVIQKGNGIRGYWRGDLAQRVKTATSALFPSVLSHWWWIQEGINRQQPSKASATCMHLCSWMLTCTLIAQNSAITTRYWYVSQTKHILLIDDTWIKLDKKKHRQIDRQTRHSFHGFFSRSRTVLCGCWRLRMALHTPSGACQKRRFPGQPR